MMKQLRWPLCSTALNIDASQPDCGFTAIILKYNTS
jgi:hypothetical protein